MTLTTTATVRFIVYSLLVPKALEVLGFAIQGAGAARRTGTVSSTTDAAEPSS